MLNFCQNLSVGLTMGVVLLLTGCGGSERPSIYPTSGTILFNGQPMPLGASVTFLPLGDSGVASSGVVDEKGNLTVSTFEGTPGLAAGEYRVVVYQTTDKEPDHVDADGEIRAAVTETFQVVPKEQRIPEVYADRNKSPLTVTIKEEDNDLGTIELTSDVS